MSAVAEDTGLVEDLTGFLRDYYKDDIGQIATSDETALYIEYADLYQFDAEVAENSLDNYSHLTDYLDEALEAVDLPIEFDAEDITIRLTDTEGYLERHTVSEALASEHIGDLIAMRAQIGQVTGQMSRMEVAAFQCQRCPGVTKIPQPFTRFVEAHECDACERQGPFNIDYTQTEFVDQRKVRFEQPPEEQADGSGDELIGYCLDDLAHIGGENGLQDRAGSRVTVLGTVEIDDSELHKRGQTQPVVEKYFKPVAFIFDEETEEIDVEAYREEVEAFAHGPNPIDTFRRSIDPGLTIVGKWDVATEMATAYLFGAPRIDPDDGDMVRGDIHMLFVSDPGMRKSVFAENLAELSPQAQLRDAGGMSSEVGLTSSASQDNFGDGKWTLTPGALPRANGGHLILDEIDKGPDNFLGGIHGALEGDQQLKVNKADIQATLATRVGFMALGNPVDGRFDPYEDIADQIDLDPALMSRFDLIVTMRDTPDEEQDQEIADGVIESIDESARLEYGDLDSDDADAVTPDVPREVMQAWVKIAREEVTPMLTDDAKDVLDTFYVDVRQLNDDSETETPPVTARKLVTGWRLSAAFARCELSDEITARHAQRAVNLSKTVVGENFDPEAGVFDADRTTEGKSSQRKRVDAITEYLSEQTTPQTIEAIADATDIPEETVEHHVENLVQSRDVYEPTNGKYNTV